MKITIRPLLRKVKNFASEYTKAFILMLGGFITIIISAILEFHAEAQVDMMEHRWIWYSCQSNIIYLQGLIAQGYTSLRYLPFQDGFLFQTNVGDASDIFLSLLITGWGLAIVGTFLVMLGVVLFHRTNYLKLRKQKKGI